MRRLQDVKGEESLDVLADVLEYVMELLKNKKILQAINIDGIKDISTVKTMIKEGKNEIIHILAAIDGKTYDEFIETLDLLTLPVMLYQTFNDEALQAVFLSQAQTTGTTSSGSVMENIEESEK